MRQLLSASVCFLLLFSSHVLIAETIDYAIHVTAYAGTEGRYIYITRDPNKARESWHLVGNCSSSPNLSVYISLMPVANEQYVFLTDAPAGADKIVCITNIEELEENMLRALQIID